MRILRIVDPWRSWSKGASRLSIWIYGSTSWVWLTSFPQTMYCISPGRLFGRAVMKQAKVWTLLFLGLWQVSCVTLSNIWGAKWKIIPVNLYRRQFRNWQKRRELARIGMNPACITALRLCFFLLVLSGQLSGILRWACTPWMAGIADESAH